MCSGCIVFYFAIHSQVSASFVATANNELDRLADIFGQVLLFFTYSSPQAYDCFAEHRLHCVDPQAQVSSWCRFLENLKFVCVC